MRKALRYFLFACLLCVFAALLAEVVLEVAFRVKDRHAQPLPVRDYPYLYYLFDSTEGLNQYGFKTQYPVEKQEGKFRIILTGGSVARGKKPQESIAHYLEKELNTRFNTDKIEVINAGISAFVVEQEFILIQLLLQQYQPDMIVSLDGVNDLMTFDFNRMTQSDFPLPPHHWDEVKVIEPNRERRKALTRFPLFFKNIMRVIMYFKTEKFEKDYDWSRLTDERLKKVSDTYWQIIKDTHDFCGAKNIRYYNFLQPVRTCSQYRKGTQLTEREKAQCRLFEQMDSAVKNEPYNFSLTTVLDDRLQLFYDFCHVVPAGNEVIAHAMAERVAEDVESWLTY